MTEHAALLDTGEVLLWGLLDRSYSLWDPTSNVFRSIPYPDGDVVFNSGHVSLGDGRILMVGGGTGHTTARTFDRTASGSPWSTLGGSLSTPRFYPTPVLLPSGAVFVGSGDYLTGPDPKAGPSRGRPAEIFDPAQDRWVEIVDLSQADERLPSVDLYPHMFLLPSGRIVYLPIANDFSGKITAPAILELDGPRMTEPSTTKGWQSLPLKLQRRTNGAAVLLIDDTQAPPIARILAVGDGPTSELIDFGDELSPTVVVVSLNLARGDHPGVLALPTGAVLVVDGDLRTPLAPEVFDGMRWALAGPAPKFIRGHHSEAVLLPDGRVLTSSDGLTKDQKRVVFLIPWGDRTVLGTTDTFYDAAPEAVHADAGDVAYLLKLAN
jgi:hypothetical protein